MLKKKINLGVYIYCFGGYDKLQIDNSYKLPDNMKGYIYILETDTIDERNLKKFGWTLVKVKPIKGNQYVNDNRLTSKFYKWCCPPEIKQFDWVLTHDANKIVNYNKVYDWLIRTADDNTDYIMKDWPFMRPGRDKLVLETRPGRVWIEMNSCFKNRPALIRNSRKNCREWYDYLKSLPDYDDVPYFETDIFFYRPNRNYLIAETMLQKCKLIQRDQFIVPWCFQVNKVNTKVVSRRHIFGQLGFRKLPTRAISHNKVSKQ